MIRLPSVVEVQVEVNVYVSADGYVVVSHAEPESETVVPLVMSISRAIELAKAIRKVASEAVENGES